MKQLGTFSNAPYLVVGIIGFSLLAAGRDVNLTPAGPGAAGAGSAKVQMPSGLGKAVEKSRYRIRERELGYYAVTPAQGMQAGFSGQGLSVSASGAGDWRWGMSLRGYGYGERQVPVQPPTLVTSDNRIEYRRGPVTEWYVNEPRGLEQGFTLTSPPGTRRGNEALVVRLGISGNLSPKLSDSGEQVEFVDAHGQRVLRYNKLAAFDAAGRRLPARMSTNEDEVWLEVDDCKAAYPVTIDPLIGIEKKLTASDAQPNDRFGSGVAIDGDTAVVTASHDDTSAGDNSGSAYIYVRDGMDWIEQAHLIGRVGAGTEQFGASVALSGDTIVVGYADDTTGGSYKGSASIFVRNGTSWTQQAQLFASDGKSGDRFGSSVAISGDTVIVGAPRDETPKVDAGSAYIFVRNGTTWTEQAHLFASSPATSAYLGHAVAINGTTAVAGAPFENGSGAVHIWARNGSSWIEQAHLIASDTQPSDEFGEFVAISGNTVVVGAPFDNTVTGSNAGSVYIFVNDGTAWSEQAHLFAGDAAADRLFGYTVAIDGDTAVLGSNAGAAYVFSRSGSAWSQQLRLSASDAGSLSGYPLRIAFSGDTAVIGGKFADTTEGVDAGVAYIYRLSPAVPITINSDPAGRAFTITGNGCQAGAYTTPKTLTWPETSSCTVSFDSPQTIGAGTQVVFTSWNDGATTPTRTFTNLTGSPTYTAQFKTQYQLSTFVTPAGTGSASGAGFYDAGTSANLDASPNSGYKFVRWWGPVSSLSSASTTVAMDAPQSVTASFSLPTTVSVAPASGKYGDTVTLSATLGPADAVFSGTLQFWVNASHAGAPIAISGAGTYTTSRSIPK